MAATIQPAAQLIDFLEVVKRKKWWLVFPPILGLLVAMIALSLIPKVFEANTLVEIKEVILRIDPSVRDPREHPVIRNLPILDQQLKDLNRLARIVGDELQWESYLKVKDDPADRRAYLEGVAQRLEVSVAHKQLQTGNDRVIIKFRDHDPDRARDFVEALSAQWRKEARDSYIALVEEQHSQRKEAWNVIAQNLEQITRSMNRLITENDLPSAAGEILTQNAPPPDPKEQLLAEREESLRKLGEQLAELEPKLAAAQSLLDTTDEVIWKQETKEVGGLPDDLVALAAELDTRKRELELQIKERRWSRVHPTRRRLQRELDQVLEELAGLQREVEVRTEESRVANPAWQAQFKKVRSLRDQIAGLESRHKALADTLPKLRREVQLRKDAYAQLRALKLEYISKDKELEGIQADARARLEVLQTLRLKRGDPFDVILTPIRPKDPVEPEPALVLSIGVIAGLIFGAVMLLLSEYGRLSFRTVEDAASFLSVPVLGAVNRIWTIPEIRRRRLTRLLSTLVVLLFLGGVAGFVYLYRTHPDRLPLFLTQLLDNMGFGET